MQNRIFIGVCLLPGLLKKLQMIFVKS